MHTSFHIPYKCVVVTGLADDLEKAHYLPLDVHVEKFKCALEYVRRCNRVYAQRQWGEEHGSSRLSMEGQPLGLLRFFASCLKRQSARPCGDHRVRQQGPADAVAGGQDGHLRGSEFAGVGSYEERVAPAAETLASLRVWLQDHNNFMPRGLVSRPRVSPEVSVHELPIHNRFLDAIACGLKTVESRLNVAVPASIDKGHVLKFGHLRCLVKERRVYGGSTCSVRAVLEDLGVEALLSGCGSVEDAVRIYHAIDSSKKVLAFVAWFPFHWRCFFPLVLVRLPTKLRWRRSCVLSCERSMAQVKTCP